MKPLTVSDWIGATHDALALLREARTARLQELGCRDYSEASRCAGTDWLCRRIEHTRTVLEDQVDGLSYLPGYTPLRDVLGKVYGSEVTT